MASRFHPDRLRLVRELTATLRQDGTTLHLHVDGDLDLRAEARLRDAFAATVDARPACLVLDMSGVSFMDSTGVRLLLGLRRDARGAGIDLRVTASEPVTWVLEMCGLEELVPA